MNGKMHKKIAKIFSDQRKQIKVVQTIYFGSKTLYMTESEVFNFVKKVIMKDKTIDFKDSQESLNKVRKAIGKETSQS